MTLAGYKTDVKVLLRLNSKGIFYVKNEQNALYRLKTNERLLDILLVIQVIT